MKKDPIVWMLRVPCNTCVEGPTVLADRSYTCGFFPVNGKCSDWEEAEVLIVYDEEPE